MIVILACGTLPHEVPQGPFPQPEQAITADTISQVRELASLPQPGGVTALAWSPDGTILALSNFISIERLGHVKLLDVQTGNVVQSFTQVSIAQIVFSPNGELLAGIGSQNLIVWRLIDGTELIKMPLDRNGIGPIGFSADSSRLVYRHKNTIYLLAVPSGDLVSTLPQEGKQVGFVILPDQPVVLTSGRSPNEIHAFRLWDINTGSEVDSFNLPILHPIDVQSLTLVPGQMQIAMPIGPYSVRIFNLQTGELIMEWGDFRFGLPPFTFSPDGEILAAGEGVGFEKASPSRLRLLDIQNKLEVLMLEGHKEPIWALAFSPDGRLLATGSETVRLWGIPAVTGE